MSTEQVWLSPTYRIEVVRREDRLFLRYDVGSHMERWREDEITEDEYHRVREGTSSCDRALLEIRKRLIDSGVDPYQSNWKPE